MKLHKIKCPSKDFRLIKNLGNDYSKGEKKYLVLETIDVDKEFEKYSIGDLLFISEWNEEYNCYSDSSESVYITQLGFKEKISDLIILQFKYFDENSSDGQYDWLNQDLEYFLGKIKDLNAESETYLFNLIIRSICKNIDYGDFAFNDLIINCYKTNLHSSISYFIIQWLEEKIEYNSKHNRTGYILPVQYLIDKCKSL